VLRAKYFASYCWPGWTCIVVCSGLKSHGSLEFTPPSNTTVTVRSTWALPPTGASTACFSRRTPNTFSHAMRYSGTSAKVKAKAASATPTILPMPMVFFCGAFMP
jgi:hypothetical protein